ncbi:MAG: DUF192 domain-containing protein [Balneola sp.]|nr:DUF192 domain-containing protein [Balneola sp.]
MLNRLCLITLSIMLLNACGEPEKKKNPTETKGRVLEYTNTLSFLSADGEVVSTLRFVKADNEAERNQGLMDVNSMPSDAGMVFYFDTEEPQSFYMMNTPLSLDIMYVNADSVIVNIYKSTTPFSSKTLPSGEPAKYVVETNAGYSISNDIKEGMKVRF